MNKYKYISTTLPYINSTPHIGHCYEFVLADVIAEYHRFDKIVFFNVGIDEHGQKVYQKSIENNYTSPQEYCDSLALIWSYFCHLFEINYDNFYRTTDACHKENVLRFYNEIREHLFINEYEGKYCIGCESYITEKEMVDGKCSVHNIVPTKTAEKNTFLNLQKFSSRIIDVLLDKSKSDELKNIIHGGFDLSITREHVKWGIPTGDGDVFYVWFEALLNYIFAIKYYQDKDYFTNYWENSLIICGKDNLKFQAFILQAILLSNNIPQTKEILVHGNILDSNGVKLSKTTGNIINPIEQVKKYGVDAVRYYLVFGLNTFDDSRYSETELVHKWNNDIVNGLGNLIARLLHLINLKQVVLNEHELTSASVARIVCNINNINLLFSEYKFKEAGKLLNEIVFKLNRRITIEKPFDKECADYTLILNEIYWELKYIIKYYGIVLKLHNHKLQTAFQRNEKIILFERI